MLTIHSSARARQPGHKTWVGHSPLAQNRASYLPPLSLTFLISEMEVIIILESWSEELIHV